MASLIFFDSVCEDPFWNATLSYGSSWPKFTKCFVYTIFVWPPCIFLLVSALLKFTVLIFKSQKTLTKCSPSLPLWVRLMGVAIMIVISIYQLVESCKHDQQYASGYILVPLSYTLRLVTFICVMCLLLYDSYKQVVSSASLFVFWTMVTVSGAFYLYEKTMVQDNIVPKTDLILTSIMYAIVIVEFLLSFIADIPKQDNDGEMKTVWPEERTSIPVKIFYLYVISIVRKAWKKGLRDEDIYILPESWRTKILVSEFSQIWNKMFTSARQSSKQVSAFFKLSQFLKSNVRDKLKDSIAANGIKYQTFDSPPASSGLDSKNQTMIPYGKDTINHACVSNSEENDAQKKLTYASQSLNGIDQEQVQLSETEQESTNEEKEPPFLLLKVIFKLHGFQLFIMALMRLVADLILLLQPILFMGLISLNVKDNTSVPQWVGILLSVAVLLVCLVRIILFHLTQYWSMCLGLKIKSQLTSTIFRKTLSINNKGRKNWSTGEIITLISVDTDRFPEMLRLLILFMRSPITFIGGAIFLYYTLGISILIGIAYTLFVALPLITVLIRRMKYYEDKHMELKGKRLKLTTDVISGMKVLKLYAWERSFEEKILNIRAEEMRILRKQFFCKASMDVFNWFTPYLLTLIVFAGYIELSEDHYLDPTIGFTAVIYFQLMKGALQIISIGANIIIMGWVGFRRINKFLFSETLDDTTGSHPEDGSAISIVDGTFSWDSEFVPTIERISFHIPANALTMIVGRVGCGKSSLLSAMMGEMQLLSGSVNRKGSVAYVAQTAWIQNATVKENILFSNSFDPVRYSVVIKACALDRDLKLLPNEDETEIGEKGVNLSGGQKQRLSLARALYSNRDIFILDDPLSAVDAYVGKHIFEEVIGSKGLLKHKTRVLVTHGIHWLSYADLIIMLDNRTICFKGTYQELQKQDSTLLQTLQQLELEDAEAEKESGPKERASSFEKDSQLTFRGAYKSQRSVSLSDGLITDQRSSLDSPDGISTVVNVDDDTDRGRLMTPERMEEGTVKWHVIWMYLKAGGVLTATFSFLTILIYATFSAAANFWLRMWTEDQFLTNTSLSATAEYRAKTDFYLAFYGVFGVPQLVFLIPGCFFIFVFFTQASLNIHKKMLHSILGSPMEFFDTVPAGRLLNRFSSDLAVVDQQITFLFSECLRIFSIIVVSIFVVIINVPLFASVIVPVGIALYLLLVLYLPTARQLRRMDTVTRSPIFSLLYEAMGGVSTIRAFDYTSHFLSDVNQKIDFNIARSLSFEACSSWVSVSVDFLGVLCLFAIAIFSVVTDSTTGGATGLALYFSQEFTTILWFVVRVAVMTTGYLVSIERIQEYSILKSEKYDQSIYNSPPDEWPSRGQIEFRNFDLCYRTGLDLVLKKINITIMPGEKIGIVGRTGAGKSSMTLALFRIIEAAGGCITVDGIDIANVDLTTLRSKLSILPQDPVLFCGSLRINIDPHNEYSDEQIMKALEQAHLKDFVNETGGLSSEIGEEGTNMSVGQRQLVCLARALLRQNKILVLDEATAGVDVETDSLIQATIHSAFSGCTVIAIAHRINTILDYDRILVLDEGEVKEFAPVNDLLSNKNSLFYMLASEANVDLSHRQEAEML